MKNTTFSNVNVELISLGGFFQLICTKAALYIKFNPKFKIISKKFSSCLFLTIFGYFNHLAIITLTAKPLTEMLHHFHNIKILWFWVCSPIFIKIMTIYGHFLPCYGQKWPRISFGLFGSFFLGFWSFLAFISKHQVKLGNWIILLTILTKICYFMAIFRIF